MSVGKLPEGWVGAPVSAVTTLIRGVTYKKEQALNYLKEGYLPLIRANNIQNGKFETSDLVFIPENLVKEVQKIKPEDIVIAMSSGSKAIVGKSAYQPLPFECSFGAFCGALRPEKNVSPKYIAHFTQSSSYRNRISSLSAGANINNIKPASFEFISLPIPPLTEQKIIAEKLDNLLSRVESIKTRLENIPALLKKFRQSVLSAAVSGKLTEEWRNETEITDNPIIRVQLEKDIWAKKNPNHNEFKRVLKSLKSFKMGVISSNEELPPTWSWQRLEDSVLMIVDCHNKTAPYIESGIPIIRTSNIRNGRFTWQGLKHVNQEVYEYWSRRCPPQAGDIIFTREAPMGEAAIIPADYKLCLGQRTMLIRTVESQVTAKYLLLVILSPSFKKRAEAFAVGTGVKHYRVGDVSDLITPIPPTKEQSEIVRRTERLFAFADSVETQVNNALTRVNNLTQSILAKAFRGELSAQWRADNPDLISGINSAEALLEKISAEKLAALSGAKRGRRKTN